MEKKRGPKFTIDLDKVQRLLAAGLSAPEIASILSVSRQRIHQLAKQFDYKFVTHAEPKLMKTQANKMLDKGK